MRLKFLKITAIIIFFFLSSWYIKSQSLIQEYNYPQTGNGPPSSYRMLESQENLAIQFQSDSMVLFEIGKEILDSLNSLIGHRTNFQIKDGIINQDAITVLQSKGGLFAPEIAHLNYNLDTIWHLPLDWNWIKLWSYDMAQDEQGDFYITGYYLDYDIDEIEKPFIQKVSADGEEIWIKKFPYIDPVLANLPIMGHSIMITADDRLCVMTASLTLKSVLFWTDLEGNLEDFIIGPSWDPIILPDIVASQTSLLDPETGDIYYGLTIEGVRVVKIDSNGDLQWDTSIIEKPSNGISSVFYEQNSSMGAKKISKLKDGNLMVLGFPDRSEWQYSISKITTAGELLFTRLLGPCCDEDPYDWNATIDEFAILDFIELESGEILLAGNIKYDSDDFYKLLVMKFNAEMECSEEAKFDFTILQDSLVQFENQSIGSKFYYWDFGDGDTSSLISPQHEYASDSSYQACLAARGFCGTDTLCKQINFKDVSNEFKQQEADAPIQLNSERRELIHQGHEPIEVDLYDLNGRLIHQLQMSPGQRFRVPFKGLCFVSYLNDGLWWSQKILMH